MTRPPRRYEIGVDFPGGESDLIETAGSKSRAFEFARDRQCQKRFAGCRVFVFDTEAKSGRVELWEMSHTGRPIAREWKGVPSPGLFG